METQKLFALITDKNSAVVPKRYKNDTTENGLLLSFLRNKGIDINSEIWDDSNVDWSKYHTLIIKTPWDYVQKIDAFLAWLKNMEEQHIRIMNPPDILRWNSDKIYLKEMHEAGINVIPTLWCDNESEFKIDEFFESLKTEKIVIKPRISSSASDTFALTREDALQKIDELKKLAKAKKLMIQPFMKEIQTKGEWSLLFFNGKYSHGLLKKTKSDDFRVQSHFGGTMHLQEPSQALIESAQDIVDRFAKNCLYVRVDGLEVDSKFSLMELELIEPYLFLNGNEKSCENYYQALNTLLQQT